MNVKGAPVGYVLLPDSSNFVKASIVVATPGDKFYSNLGHVAIRMECPQHDLDYCFSFLADDNTLGILYFFAGESKGRVYAVTTNEYLASFRDEGRGVDQWELNLTLHEKQLLWQMLDDGIVEEECKKFNFAQYNCTSLALFLISHCALEGDSVNYVWPSFISEGANALPLHWQTRDMPWMHFACESLLGHEGEKCWSNIHRTAPGAVFTLLQASTVENAGQSRPLLTGKKERLVEQTIYPQTIWLTPTRLFGILTIIVLLISLGEWKLRWKRAAQIMDCTLLVAHTVLGVFLCLVTFQAGLFQTRWNWLLISINPVPLVLWLLLRKRAVWEKIYLFYAVVLTLFIAGATQLAMFYPEHGLLVAIFAVRCWAKAFLNINKKTI